MRDMIYRDEAIEAACAAAYNWDGSYDAQREKLICELIEAIQSVDSQDLKKMLKWLNEEEKKVTDQGE